MPRSGIATGNDLPAALGEPVHLDGDVGEPIDRASAAGTLRSGGDGL
uniref:Uncharacterized protein n=1 Tax=Ralstonia solanacearum TaxID=305 RepID=A0A0S4TX58_RALSL|nr:protein of unknown function [Ralstonia solanacearum]